MEWDSHRITTVLTPSLSGCHLKTTNKTGKFETLNPFLSSFFALACERTFCKTLALKVDVFQDREIYYLLAHPCNFQPGNLTGWGSEEVKSQFRRVKFMVGSRTSILTASVEKSTRSVRFNKSEKKEKKKWKIRPALFQRVKLGT